MHDELTHGNLAGLFQSITDDRIGLVGLVPIGQKIVGLFVVTAVDLDLVNEAHHVDGVLGFQLQLLNFFGVDQNVMPLGVLVALDDFFLRDLGEGVTVSHALHILDGLPGGLVNLPKANRSLR